MIKKNCKPSRPCLRQEYISLLAVVYRLCTCTVREYRRWWESLEGDELLIVVIDSVYSGNTWRRVPLHTGMPTFHCLRIIVIGINSKCYFLVTRRIWTKFMREALASCPHVQCTCPPVTARWIWMCMSMGLWAIDRIQIHEPVNFTFLPKRLCGNTSTINYWKYVYLPV